MITSLPEILLSLENGILECTYPKDCCTQALTRANTTLAVEETDQNIESRESESVQIEIIPLKFGKLTLETGALRRQPLKSDEMTPTKCAESKQQDLATKRERKCKTQKKVAIVKAATRKSTRKNIILQPEQKDQF